MDMKDQLQKMNQSRLLEFCTHTGQRTLAWAPFIPLLTRNVLPEGSHSPENFKEQLERPNTLAEINNYALPVVPLDRTLPIRVLITLET